MQIQSTLPARRVSLWIAAPLILGLTLACYWPALHGGLVWDDDFHVTKPELRSVAGLWQIWSNVYAVHQYYPLLHSAFWIEHRVWGDATLGYHLTNVLLHAAAALLLAKILRHLGVPGALLAALIFSVHPVCVESVAWISEQKNTLSLVLYLLAALAYLQFDRQRGGRQGGGTGAYLLASLLFVMALLTKSVTATLPAALLVVSWWERGRLEWRRDVKPLIPWFMVAIASGLWTSFIERNLVGAEGAEFYLTFMQRCLLASRIIWFYLGKLLWPAHLIFMYPHWDVGTSAAHWTGYLAATVMVTVALWLIRRRSRGPLAAWLFFVGSLFPALGFFSVYPFIFSYVADHFQYIASMGIIAAASAGATQLLSRASSAFQAAGHGLAAVLVAALVTLSRAESKNYVDAPTLYRTTLERNPASWLFHNNLGEYHMRRGELNEATAQIGEALRLKPDYAGAHSNMGIILARTPGRLNDSIAQFQEALRLQPDFAQAHNNLGIAYYNTPGRLKDAIAQSVEALKIEPNLAEAHNSLANDWMKAGQPDAAISEYKEALRLKPDYAEVHFNLALALLRFPGREHEAENEIAAFLSFRPDNELAREVLARLRANYP
jgi:protein O-mannosyl-transferase